MRRLEGAYSIVALSEGRLIAFRDPHGFRPLVIGRIQDDWVVASETCALDLVGAEFVREVEPGELVIADADGLHATQALEPADGGALCIWEFFYLARPDSRLEGIEVHGARVRMGEQLARESAGRRRPRPADPRLGHARRDRLRPRARPPVQRGADQEPLRPAHVHPARPGAAPAGDQAQVPPGRGGRGQARRRGRRLDRARQHDPRDRADAVRRGRRRGAPAHLVAAGGRAVLLRHRPRGSVGDDRLRHAASRRCASTSAPPRSPTSRTTASSRRPGGRRRRSAARCLTGDYPTEVPDEAAKLRFEPARA